MPEYKEEQSILAMLRIENAKEDCESAALEFGQAHYKAANNRAYYSIFHAIRAVLALESKDFKSHGQLLGYFNKNYIHKGKFDISLSKIISNANGLRTDSDYNDFFIATAEESENALEGARTFLDAVTVYLANELNGL
ncbi:MAG: HEPN domain-containing protein [Clostridiales Family XIII bacterium]|nr:HEPN domain-containing protein [Clostridiales Family XIII bacterium]